MRWVTSNKSLIIDEKRIQEKSKLIYNLSTGPCEWNEILHIQSPYSF